MKKRSIYLLLLITIVLGGSGYFFVTSGKINRVTTTTPAGTSNDPFPLDDPNARYYVESNGSGKNLRYVLNYEKSSDPQHPQAIWVSKESNVLLKEYVGKDIIISGSFINEMRQVECIQDPCPPIETTIIDIKSVHLKNPN